MSQPKASDITQANPYLAAFRGSFTSALRWHHLDDLWAVTRDKANRDWYLYHIGDQPPATPASAEQVLLFIDEIDALLRREHQEDYCAIVYADSLKDPSFIKIYDPHNLGVSCGYSENPPLPGWTMSLLPPIDLQSDQLMTKSRKRWWQKLFGD
jgi:hypothetical protein